MSEDMGVPQVRVVEVRCPYADGTSTVGSGTLLGGRLVLTAAHVVHDECSGVVRIRRSGSVEWFDALLVWPTQSSDYVDGIDAALLEIIDRRWPSPALRQLRWGRLTGQGLGVSCGARGYPRVLRDTSAWRGEEPLSGRVVSIGGLAIGRYDIHVQGAAPTYEPAAPGAAALHPWGGMSGAGLFAKGRLIGVIVIDQPGFPHNRLTAIPADVLMRQQGFVAVLDSHQQPAAPSGGSNAEVVRSGLLDGGSPTATPMARVESVELAHLFTAAQDGPAGFGLSPAQLLVAGRAVVPFQGHEFLVRTLRRWCLTGPEQGGPAVGVRLLFGPGGQGKTRLGLHLASIMANEHDWVAGLLRTDGTDTDKVNLEALTQSAVPALLVIDYAETRIDQLSRLLRLLVDAFDTAPIRLLLLARRAEEWWDDLRRDHTGLLGRSPLPLPLPSLHGTVAERHVAFTVAAAAFADRMPAVDPTPGVSWPELAVALPIPDLSDPAFGAPLSIQLSALNALMATGPNPIVSAEAHSDYAEGKRPAEEELIDHETRYWRDTAHSRELDFDPLTLSRAVATATLFGAATRERAIATVRRIPGLQDATDDNQLKVARWLHDLYPHPTADDYWGPLQPDRLGEHLIGTLARHDPDLIPTLLREEDEKAQYRALTVLYRAKQHQPHLNELLVPFMRRNRKRLQIPAIAAALAVTQTQHSGHAVDEVFRSVTLEDANRIWRSEWTAIDKRR